MRTAKYYIVCLARLVFTNDIRCGQKFASRMNGSNTRRQPVSRCDTTEGVLRLCIAFKITENVLNVLNLR